ncbi:MAG: hypothetical protein QG635_1040, partial [Bacteroidota bacterium]|nr:hypothetical protein [Bacteroidota bacterium]
TGNAYYQYFNMNYDYTYSGSDSFSSFGLGVSLYSGYNHMAGIMLTGNMIITGQTVYMGGIHGRLNIFDTRILGLEAMASMYIHTEEDAFYCLNLIFKIY